MRPIILSVVLLVSASGVLAAADGVDVVARVNDHVITRQEVRALAAEIIKRLEPTADPVAVARESLENQKLVLDEGEKLLSKDPALKARVEERVQEEIERAAQAAGSKAALHSQLIRKGSSLTDFKKELRDGLLIDVALMVLVRHEVDVAPSRVRELYEEERTRVRYRQIVVAAQPKAAELVARARAGEVFPLLAKEHSTGPHAAEGGLWELSRQAVPDLKGGIGAIILELKPGDVSDPVAVDGAYHILKRESTLPFGEVQEEYVRELTREARDKKLEQLINRLRREGHIEIARSRPEESDTSED